MHLDCTNSANDDIVRQGMAPMTASATSAGKAMVPVGLNLGSTHTLVGANQRGAKTKPDCYAQFIVA